MSSSNLTNLAIESLEATIESIRGDPTRALKMLEGRNDPHSVRRRLSILLEIQRLPEASTETYTHDLSEMWVDIAAYIRACLGDVAGAQDCVDWSAQRDKESLLHRTTTLFIQGLMQWAFRERKEASRLVPASISEKEAEVLRGIVAVVEPISAQLLGRRALESEVQTKLLEHYIDTLFLLNERAKVARIVDKLLTRSPIPPKVGEAVLQGLNGASQAIVERLWDEHPNNFRPRWLACAIQARDLGEPAIARDRAYSLVKKAQSLDEREDLCELLYELSDKESSEEVSKLRTLTESLLGSESVLPSLLRADQFIRAGEPENAIRLLEAIRDDSSARWLHSYAQAKLSLGEGSHALTLFKSLGQMVAHPSVFRAIEWLAAEQKQPTDERMALAATLGLDPKDFHARWRLAMLFVKEGDYKHAAEQLEKILAARPEDTLVTCNLAITYGFLAEFDRALALLPESSVPEGNSFAVIKTRAQLLQAAGRPYDAYMELKQARGAHWNNPEFLMLCLQIGYASGHEREAHEALVRLQELQQEGAAPKDLLRAVSLDEMLSWAREKKKREEELRRSLLVGTVPWLTVSEAQGEVPLWSWLLRTQSLEWLSDDPLNRAAHTVYATNSFRVFENADGTKTLEQVECPRAGSPVVVDLSALITLHQLGILQDAATYFGKLHVPALYLANVLEDTRKLLPHQQSQKTAAEQILSALGSGGVTPLDAASGLTNGMARVDEYDDELRLGQFPLRLFDLLGALHSAGRLSDDQWADAIRAAHKPSVVGEGGGTLTIGMPVLVGLLTLTTLSSLGLFHETVRSFDVYLSRSDCDEVRARNSAFEALDRARTSHGSLWKSLRDNSRIRFEAVRIDLEYDVDDSDGRGFSFAAIKMAQDLGLPLLADDRAGQTVILNSRMSSEVGAFGTDALICGLLKAGAIEVRKAAQLFLMLINWRYRFALLPVSVMKELATQYRAHPPGAAMLDVARYIHDCMRDPGLFGGTEQTTQPMSIAIRLYQTWAHLISELVMALWVDTTVEESFAEKFTQWAVTECLPSPPRVLNDATQAAISSLTARTVVARALISAGSTTEFLRANLGLRTISRALYLSDVEYIDLVLKTIERANE